MGCCFEFFMNFLNILISFCVLCYFQHYKIILIHLLIKWEVVSPNSRQWESISNISSIPLFQFLFISNLWVVWGGGNIFLAFYAIFLFRKTILSHFMFSSCFMPFPTFLEKFRGGGGGG